MTLQRRARVAGERQAEVGAASPDTLKRFETFIFPEIGRRPIARVAAPELLAVLRKIEARGTIETAHKVARACGQVFRFAIASGRCERNPAADLRGALKAKPKAKHMAALPADDLPDLLRGHRLLRW